MLVSSSLYQSIWWLLCSELVFCWKKNYKLLYSVYIQIIITAVLVTTIRKHLKQLFLLIGQLLLIITVQEVPAICLKAPYRGTASFIYNIRYMHTKLIGNTNRVRCVFVWDLKLNLSPRDKVYNIMGLARLVDNGAYGREYYVNMTTAPRNSKERFCTVKNVDSPQSALTKIYASQMYQNGNVLKENNQTRIRIILLFHDTK